MMWNKTIVTETLDIKYPIIQAGMAGGVTTPELIAAVSNSGALGNLGAGYMSPNVMREDIQEIKQLTNKPFGVNVFVPETSEASPEEIDQANEWLEPFRNELGIAEPPSVNKPDTSLFHKQIEVIIQEKVPVCSFTFGLPDKKIIQQLKEKNVIVIGTATTVEEALANEAYGMDMVVMQGSEAGGHRGTFQGPTHEAMIGTTALIPQTVDRISIPVIAAGGIMDGRGVLSALILGADAAQMGSTFVTCEESGAKKQHKAAILQSETDNTVVTPVFSGKAARGIRNDFIAKMEQHQYDLPAYPLQNTLTKEIRSEAAQQNRPDMMSLWSGQNPGGMKQQSAGDMISSIIAQMEEMIHHKFKKS